MPRNFPWPCVLAKRSGVKPQRSSASVRLVVERLESRCVPAGNVTATLDGNTLRIIGDVDPNGLFIYESGPNVVVEGDATTSVNGGSSANFSGVANLDIRIEDGNDIVIIGEDAGANVTGLSLSGWLRFLGGNGDDDLTLRQVGVTKTTTIRGNDGDDDVVISDFSSFARNVTIALDTGTGTVPEIIFIDDSSFSFPTALRGSNVKTTVSVNDSSFSSTLTIRTSSAGDVVNLVNLSASTSSVSIWLGSGDDFLGVQGSSFGTITANAGLGNDQIRWGTTSSNSVALGASFLLGDGTNDLVAGAPLLSNSFGLLNILGGSGVDTVSLNRVQVSQGATFIDLRSGNDWATIANSTFRPNRVWVQMGAGNDTLRLINNIFETMNQDRFDGGLGTDTIVNSGNSGLASSEVIGFP